MQPWLLSLSLHTAFFLAAWGVLRLHDDAFFGARAVTPGNPGAIGTTRVLELEAIEATERTDRGTPQTPKAADARVAGTNEAGAEAKGASDADAGSARAGQFDARSGTPGADGVSEYLAEIRRRIEGSLRARARRLSFGSETQVRLAVVVARDGSIASVEIRESSGQEELDRAALEAVRAAAPFPPAPGGDIRFQLPLKFRPQESS